MSSPIPPEAIRTAAAWIRSARHAVALTGAGTSTPSGIPDFRSPGSGLWERYDPAEVASLGSFRRDPQRFYDWVRPLARGILASRPNPGHLALARLERAGRLQAVITQNIDGLHQRAGSRNVFEVHGSLNALACMDCAQRIPSAPYLQAFLEHGEMPRCPGCGGVLKPDIVLFEELLPVAIWEGAWDQAAACDLMLVIGSSLEVMPVGGLPALAVEHGARLIIVNLAPTALDRRAGLVLRGDLAQILPQIASAALDD